MTSQLPTRLSQSGPLPLGPRALKTSEYDSHADGPQAKRAGGWWRAFAAGLSLMFIWLGVLPWLADWVPIRNHVESLRAADINASAMFYSELDCKYRLDP